MINGLALRLRGPVLIVRGDGDIRGLLEHLFGIPEPKLLNDMPSMSLNRFGAQMQCLSYLSSTTSNADELKDLQLPISQ